MDAHCPTKQSLCTWKNIWRPPRNITGKKAGYTASSFASGFSILHKVCNQSTHKNSKGTVLSSFKI